MKTCCKLVMAALLVMISSVAQAELNSKQRVQAFAKLPDWSGLWEQLAIDASGRGVLDTNSKQQATAGGIESMAVALPPYNAEWQAKFQGIVDRTAQGPGDVICTIGFPSLMIGSPLMFQPIVTPEETTLIFSQRETRHIYTDGSPHPAKDELWAMSWGNSIGRWEGQVLVVDTIATSSPLITGVPGVGRVSAPLSDQAHFIERIRMMDRNTLENEILVEDPVAFTQPWRLVRQYHRVPNMKRLIDEDCQGNDRNPVVDGKLIIAPP